MAGILLMNGAGLDQPISGISIGDAPGATLTVTLSVGQGH
jgi:hypothetical protein